MPDLQSERRPVGAYRRYAPTALALSLLAALAVPAASQTGAEVEGAFSGREIVLRAYAANGGETWRRPRTLRLSGWSVVYPEGRMAGATVIDDYRMWRVFPAEGGAAHQANGQVRFEGRADGERLFLISYDGETTVTGRGPLALADADRRWSAAFGFSVIRFAADDGFATERLADTNVDGRRAFVVRVTDPANSETVFAIDQETYAVLRVGFATPEGWHERVYSDFFWVEAEGGGRFRQPGALRLVYDGVVEREIRWTEAEVNVALDPALFSDY